MNVEPPFTSCVDVWSSIDPWLSFRIHSMKQPRNFIRQRWTPEAIKLGLVPSAFLRIWQVRSRQSKSCHVWLPDIDTRRTQRSPNMNDITSTRIPTSLSSTLTQGTHNITTWYKSATPLKHYICRNACQWICTTGFDLYSDIHTGYKPATPLKQYVERHNISWVHSVK